MQAADCVLFDRKLVILLDQVSRQTGGRKFAAAVGFRKKPRKSRIRDGTTNLTSAIAVARNSIDTVFVTISVLAFHVRLYRYFLSTKR